MKGSERRRAIVSRVENGLGVPGLSIRLAQGLIPTDLQSLMLEVYRRLALARRPATVLERWVEDAFVRPSPVAATTLLELDRLAFGLAGAEGFVSVELAPLTPLSTCSSVAPVDPVNVVCTSRNTEVVSDPTNVLALECAVRRRALLHETPRSTQVVRLCASHRVVRGQRFDAPGFTQHFRLLALCTAGRDRGTLRFECDALREHLRVHLGLLGALRSRGAPLEGIEIRLIDRSRRHHETLEAEVVEPLRGVLPGVTWVHDHQRDGAREYYPGISFMIDGRDPQGVILPLADGGFTGWTASLLSNRKERLLVSGMGTELVCARFGVRTEMLRAT